MSQEKFLIVRRDNIGDLICTLPLLRAIRQQRPDARIVVLANRYNAPVLTGNPDIDAIFAYQKGKHRGEGEGILDSVYQRLRMVWQLRQEKFDWILLPGGFQSSAERMANWIGARQIVRLDDRDRESIQHEVELTCRLLPKVGLNYQAPNASIYPDPIEAGTVGAVLGNRKKWVAIHISARKISQRWPAERFAGLIQQLNAADPELGFLLLWAPGDESDPKHPGDNAKAEAIISAIKGLPVVPFPTYKLESLIAALSFVDSVICCDGGAMHVAAGLGKTIVCLFGDSDPARWRPWGVPHQLLQANTRNVNDIEITTVFNAWRLLSRAAMDTNRE